MMIDIRSVYNYYTFYEPSNSFKMPVSSKDKLNVKQQEDWWTVVNTGELVNNWWGLVNSGELVNNWWGLVNSGDAKLEICAKNGSNE